MNTQQWLRRLLVLPTVSALALAGAVTAPMAGAATPPTVTAATATPSAVGLSGLETATVVVEATLSGDLPTTGGCVQDGRSASARLSMGGPAGAHEIAATAVPGDPSRYRGTWIVDAADNGAWSLTEVGLYDAACQITWFQVGATPPVGQLTVAGTNAPVMTLTGPVRSVRWSDAYPISGRVTFGGIATTPVADYPVRLEFNGGFNEAGGSPGPDVVTVRTDAKGAFRYVRTDVESGIVRARLFSPALAAPVEDVDAALVRAVDLPLKVRAYLTATATPSVRRGQRAVVSGVIVPWGCGLLLQRRVGTRWVPVTRLVRGTRWDTYAFSVKPTATTTYRVVTDGLLSYPAVSPPVTVRAR